jgi:hypothetical protein
MSGIAVTSALGAFSMGAVVAYLAMDRTALLRSSGDCGEPSLWAWVFALGAGTVTDAIILGGFTVLPWLAAGTAMGGLIRLAIERALGAGEHFVSTERGE